MIDLLDLSGDVIAVFEDDSIIVSLRQQGLGGYTKQDNPHPKISQTKQQA